MDLNEVILLGRLGRDPESKELPTTKLTTFSVATTRKWKDGRGEWQEQTDWHDVKCFGKTAEIAAKLRKADKVLIKGALTVEQWEKDGKKNKRTVVNAMLVECLTAKQARGEEPSKYRDDVPPQSEDDIPF